MVGFYHGTQIPGNDANEGIYFIKAGTSYSIYTKRNGMEPERYADINEVTSATIEGLWNRIGQTFVQKSFTVAGLSLENDISVTELTNALGLKSLAYKDSATGTIEDYVTELNGVNYTPTGKVEINLGYEDTVITSTGSYLPAGEITGTTVAKGHIQLAKNENGFEISGTISQPTATVNTSDTKIKQISNVGTLPSYTPAVYTAPTVSEAKAAFATGGMIASVGSGSSVLTFTMAETQDALVSTGFNQGGYTAAQFNPGTLPEIDSTLSVITNINSVDISRPTFTGDKINATFIGEESDIDAEFKGTSGTVSVTGTYGKAKINSASFNGDGALIKPTLTKENKTITVQ